MYDWFQGKIGYMKSVAWLMFRKINTYINLLSDTACIKDFISSLSYILFKFQKCLSNLSYKARRMQYIAKRIVDYLSQVQ